MEQKGHQLILKQRFDHSSFWSVKPRRLQELTCTYYHIWVPETELNNLTALWSVYSGGINQSLVI